MAEQDLLSLVKRLEAVALKLESTAGGSGGAGKSLLFNVSNRARAIIRVFDHLTRFFERKFRQILGDVARPPCLDCPASVAVCGVLNELEVAVLAAVDGHGHVALLQIFST